MSTAACHIPEGQTEQVDHGRRRPCHMLESAIDKARFGQSGISMILGMVSGRQSCQENATDPAAH